MASLSGKLVLVAGGAGHVGERIAAAFLREGATVVVPSRSRDRLDPLRRELDPRDLERLVPVVGDVGEPAGAERIRDEVAERGELHAVVASLGGWWQGRGVIELDLATWQRLLNDLLTSHFVVARTFLPAMVERGSGSYTLVNGVSAETPHAGAGPVSVAAAGQLMLAQVLMRELSGTGVCVNELVLGPVTTRVRDGRGRPGWITGDDVGQVAVQLASPQGMTSAGRVLRLTDRSALPRFADA